MLTVGANATQRPAIATPTRVLAQASAVFAGRHGFITPRDLFRWAERRAVGYQVVSDTC
jgi:midasin